MFGLSAVERSVRSATWFRPPPPPLAMLTWLGVPTLVWLCHFSGVFVLCLCLGCWPQPVTVASLSTCCPAPPALIGCAEH
ncbi:unnamed protein product [Gadus morhua 'NCC']